MNNKNWKNKEQPRGSLNKGAVKGVYILHFARPVDYANAHLFGDKQHYVGASVDIMRRVLQHKEADGSKMTTAAKLQNIKFEVASITVTNQPALIEAALTKDFNRDRCPICLAQKYALNLTASKDFEKTTTLKIK